MKVIDAPYSSLRGAALLLAGAMLLIPFLQPRHLPPLRAFYDEWLAFALGLAAMAVAAAAPRKESVRVPVPAVLLALFALTLFARAVGQQSAYPQSPLVWGLYAAFATLVLMLGRDLAEDFGTQRVCDVLAAFILAGALANSVCAAFQTVGVPQSLSDFVSHRQGTRAIGNIGQSNLYANYLALGEASIVYLYMRGKTAMLPALACAIALAASAALASSRASSLYAIGFALLGWYGWRRRKDSEASRLGLAALVVAACVITFQWAVPAGMSALGYSVEGGIARNTPADWDGPLPDEAANLRVSAWSLAYRVFLDFPWLGAGPGEFAGAAFVQGLPPELAGSQLWTSPHNLVLHLLSETGLAGALIVCAALLLWLRGAWRSYTRECDAPRWWLLACAGVELAHALLEYPLWYAHFLAITSLLIGVSSVGAIPCRQGFLRVAFGVGAAIGATILAFSLAAYLRFDLASPVAAGRSLAGDSAIARDRDTLAGLGRTLFAPRAETLLFLSFPLDGSELPEKIDAGRRVMRVWPVPEVIGRQAIFLALAGRDDEARALLERGFRTFPKRRPMFAEMIEAAPARAREKLQSALRKVQSQGSPKSIPISTGSH